MWDLILAVFLTAHVLAGIVAAFVAFPVAALATKGGSGSAPGVCWRR